MEIECVNGPLDGMIVNIAPPGDESVELSLCLEILGMTFPNGSAKYQRSGRMMRSQDGWFQKIFLKWIPEK